MVDIHIYGKLRCYAQDIPTDSDNVIRVTAEPDETLVQHKNPGPQDQVRVQWLCHLNGSLI